MNGLSKKIAITLLLLLVYRVGSFIPVPYLDVSKLSALSKYTQSGVFSMFNMLSGGALSRMSVFALSIVPYITSSIVIQLTTSAVPHLKALKNEGESGQRQIHQYTRYLAILISFFQGFAIANGIGSMELFLGADPSGAFTDKLAIALTLATGTLLLTWLGEQITVRGIGNGISLMIFVGIVADFPKAFASLFELSRTGTISPIVLLFIIAVFLANIAAIVLFEKSYRIVKVQQSRQVSQYGGFGRMSSSMGELPLKVNPSGVIPPIFAGSVLLLPVTLIGFLGNGSTNEFVTFISRNFVHGKPMFVLAYIALIFFFTYFYTGIVFDTKETANHLRKGNVIIPGVRPGDGTILYLDNVMRNLCFIGAAYISAICVVPELLSSVYAQFYILGGTGLLIVVNVATDTVSQIQLHMMSSKYDKFSQN